MRHLAIALAALIAAPAFAQPATNAPNPASGVQAPAAATETDEEVVRRWEREQVIYASRPRLILEPVTIVTAEDLMAALDQERADAETPLPPPCDMQPARDVTVPKPPAPCTPQPPRAQPASSPTQTSDKPDDSAPKPADPANTKKTIQTTLDELLAGIKPCDRAKGCRPSAAAPPRSPATTAAPKPE